eukprot:366943_1
MDRKIAKLLIVAYITTLLNAIKIITPNNPDNKITVTLRDDLRGKNNANNNMWEINQDYTNPDQDWAIHINMDADTYGFDEEWKSRIVMTMDGNCVNTGGARCDMFWAFGFGDKKYFVFFNDFDNYLQVGTSNGPWNDALGTRRGMFLYPARGSVNFNDGDASTLLSAIPNNQFTFNGVRTNLAGGKADNWDQLTNTIYNGKNMFPATLQFINDPIENTFTFQFTTPKFTSPPCQFNTAAPPHEDFNIYLSSDGNQETVQIKSFSFFETNAGETLHSDKIGLNNPGGWFNANPPGNENAPNGARWSHDGFTVTLGGIIKYEAGGVLGSSSALIGTIKDDDGGAIPTYNEIFPITNDKGISVSIEVRPKAGSPETEAELYLTAWSIPVVYFNTNPHKPDPPQFYYIDGVLPEELVAHLTQWANPNELGAISLSSGTEINLDGIVYVSQNAPDLATESGNIEPESPFYEPISNTFGVSEIMELLQSPFVLIISFLWIFTMGLGIGIGIKSISYCIGKMGVGYSKVIVNYNDSTTDTET